MDNAQLRVMKKKNNKKIASLDKKNKKNKNFVIWENADA